MGHIKDTKKPELLALLDLPDIKYGPIQFAYFHNIFLCRWIGSQLKAGCTESAGLAARARINF